MDSRRRQRSIALNHIPTLPIPHGLEYPLSSRVHLCVVNPRLEGRRRPFARFSRCRSRVNPRVFRPLSRGPQGQPSPLRTPHIRPGVQGLFTTSRRQAPHGWPMIHHSMATGFPIPRGCCSVFSASPRLLVRIPATSLSPLPGLVTHHGLSPASRAFPLSWGCCAALATLPSQSRPLLPSSHVYTPPGCQQPCGAGPLDPHPSGDCFVRLARVAPIPSPFVWVVCFFLDLLGVFLPGPAIGSPGTCAYSPPGHLRLFFFRAPPAAPLLHRLLLPVSPLPARSVLFALRQCFVVFFPPPPPPFSCASCLVVSCPCRLCWFFFYPLPCMHARQHCTGPRVRAFLGVRLRSHPPHGACPLAVPGHARWAPLPRVCLLSLPSSLPSPPPPSPVSRPPSYCCSPAPCALRCSSPRQRCISLALTRLSASALSSVL